MKKLIGISFILFFATPLIAQEAKTVQRDTVNPAIQLRYLIFTMGAGLEFPFKEHSFGLQFNKNYLPSSLNIHDGFDHTTIIAVEYKLHILTGKGSSNYVYYGGQVLYRGTEYGTPEEWGWGERWDRSNSINLGPLAGFKSYFGSRLYFELFAGPYGGWKWGKIRHDVYNEPAGGTVTSFTKADGYSYGFRLGFSVGFEL